jgi:tetratricopeptide (TPR) repeat protein
MALVVGTVFAVFRRRTHVAWLAIAHLLAFVMWTTVDRATSTAMDYYRLWGGSSRRLGDQKTAEEAYRKMTEVAPDNAQGFYQLGRLLLAREAGEEGIAALRRAQNLEPLRARAYVAEARWLSTHGRRDEAIAKAREATIVEPGDAEARALLDSLLGTR